MYPDEEAFSEIDKLFKNHGTHDPFKIVDKCDYELRYVEMPEDTWGCMVRSNRCCTIFVSITLPEHIQKFVVAHELGHSRLHKGHSTPFYRNVASASISKKEKQANVFALNLLTRDIEGIEHMTNYEILDYLGLPYDFERFL